MLAFLQRCWRPYYLARHRIDASLWQSVAHWPLLQGLSAAELALLQEQAVWFLHTQSLTPIDTEALTDAQRLAVAVQAALPVLNLGFDCFADWREVVIYPGRFRGRHAVSEPIGGGLIQERVTEGVYAGMARSDGPMLLSMADVKGSPRLDGLNVVIHEIAHKLDMRSGAANGCPPLHRGMSRARWRRAFSNAYADLQWQAQQGHVGPIDAYAAESPAECFAVLSECFFELPHVLKRIYPAVYTELCVFYRQNPASRLPALHYRSTVARPLFYQGLKS